MTTKITTIYDLIYTRVAAVLTDHKELYNPYDINKNDKLALNKGYAIILGEGSNANRVIGCHTSLNRSVTITNTLAVFGQDRNATVRKTTEKDLFENQFKIIKSFEADCDLSNNTNNFVFVSDGGIEYIFDGEDRVDYIMLRSTFNFTYFESLT